MSNEYKDWVKDRNRDLVTEYPFLLPKNRMTGEPIENYDYGFTELDEMPDAWRFTFSEQMLKELKEILVKGNYLDKYTILQIKEKYGKLRIYSNSIPKDIMKEYCEWEEKYTELSENTCYFCGDKAEAMTVGWILPICLKCAKSSKRPYELFNK